MIKIVFPSDNSIACVARTNQTFEVMLNPRASFFLSLHGSIIMVKIPIELYLLNSNRSQL